MKRSEQVGELVAALAKAQAEFTPAVKDSDNPYYNSKYADLNAVINAVRPALNKNGIAMMHTLESDLERQCAIVTVGLYHGEQFMEVTVEAPATGRAKKDERNEGAAPTKFDVQTIGACWSYLRRYTLQAICGLASEDDDGESLAGSNKPIAKKTLCPVCGKDTIIQGKPEYGGGWLCYKAKGGCGAKFDVETTAEKISETSRPTSTQQSSQQTTQRAAHAPAANQPEEQGVFKHLPDGVLVCKVRGVTEKHTDPRDGKTKPKPYLIVTVNGYLHPEGDPDNPNINGLFCYDTGLFDAIKAGVGKEVHMKIDLTTKFAKALDILEVDGVEYVDGKPVTQ